MNTFKMPAFDRPETYFPILIEYENGKQSIVQSPQEIISGIGFKVLVTQYHWPDNN